MALLAAAAGATSPTGAQEQPPLALDRFEPAPMGDRFFSQASPYPGQHLMPHVGFVLEYAHDPLVLVQEAPGGDEVLGSVVEHQLHLHLGASFGLFEWVAFNLNVPFAVYQAGDDPSGGGVGLVAPDSGEVGDLRLGAKVRIWGAFDDPVQVGVGGYLWAPTGPSDAGSYVGEGTVRGLPMVLAGGRYKWLLWSANAGPEFRAAQELVGTTQGTMMRWGAGVAAVVGPEEQVQIGPELAFATVLEDADGRNANGEGLLGVKWRFVDFMEAGLALGPGFTSGIGTPDFRGVLSLAFTPKPKRDRDGDGIEDRHDACVDEPGPASDDPARHGCPVRPDRDRDGIPDREDACPEVPGSPNPDPTLNGCPSPVDRDGDGVVDGEDACPEVAGPRSDDPAKNGCPPPTDRDGDGVLDTSDVCPDVAGVPDADPTKNGCPPTAAPLADRDGDGIADAEDACPDEPGKADPDPKKHGCPTVLVTAGEITILQKVLFDTDRATIKPVSDPILADVAEVLRTHAEIRLVEVQGHTDSQGGSAHNLPLSQARADAVKAALVQRGIDAARLTTKGFGQDVPVADNETPEGREKNRRVEFKILERAPAAKPSP